MSERLLPLTKLSKSIYNSLMGRLRSVRHEDDTLNARNAYLAFLIHEGLRV